MGQHITFDETKYNQLIAVLDDMEHDLLHEATESPTNPLDGDFELQPGTQKWDAALDLVNKGKGFGGSVEQQNEKMRQAIVRFRNALVAAKDVFKETDDLAQYDITRFVAEYPDFNTGGRA
ncbi:hypothetical protein V5P93_002774 [Actinokineospora auranticolor]|uniref:Excreted virulence factor EspC (Type VII ESX diderm) n=1 Tax=Actinokineospora auranticolor TaxID=155976 RepID=A0A2S6H0A8_9PSEU|nr:hypothetical protein [Actinokineospora auranticolor]PPK70915.1 hypothetical protein CLV40_101101 [Actinokineospora auranticolor]